MKQIKLGTCSWKYDSWKGIVYTERAKANYLLEYSKQFNTVEIDQWFWSLFGKNKVVLPSTHVVREYHDSVPENFKFTIKVPNSITLTHFYRKSKTDSLNKNPHFLSNDLFEQFMTSLEPMHNKIGVLMFQFEYLNKLKMPTLESFLDSFAQFISKCDLNFTYALEIRNPNYLNHRYFQFLKEKKMGHVFLQGYYMPSIIQVYQKFKSSFVSPAVIRLHGPDRSDIEAKSKGNWDQILEPKDEEIANISKIIEEIQAKNLDVYVNVNNHYEGSAPLTIEKIRTRLTLI